jgi:hypothetical protein
LSLSDKGTCENKNTCGKQMANEKYRHTMPGTQKDEVLAKNVSINEIIEPG